MGIYFTRDMIQSLNPDTVIQDEVYKPVLGYENLYEVSNWGNVRSLDRFVSTIRSNGRKYSQLCKGKQLSISSLGTDYLYVWLEVDPKPKNCTVHRLVAQAFLPNPSHKKIVNHIDGNKHNPYVDNLEWATYSENAQHAIRTGLLSPNITEMLNCGSEASKKPVKILETGQKFDSSTACDAWLHLPRGFTDRILSTVSDGYSASLNLHFKRISKEEYNNSNSKPESIDKASTINRGLLHASKCVKVVETEECFNSMSACDRRYGFSLGTTGDCISKRNGWHKALNIHFINISKSEYASYVAKVEND